MNTFGIVSKLLNCFAAIVLPCTLWSQYAIQGHPGSDVSRRYVLQFGPRDRGTSFVQASKKEIWLALRKGERDKFRDISGEELQTHLNSTLILVDSNLLEFTALLVQETRYASEKPNGDFLKGFRASAKAEDKTGNAAVENIDDNTISEWIAALKTNAPGKNIRAILYPDIQKWFRNYGSAKAGVFSQMEWGDESDPTSISGVIDLFVSKVKDWNILIGIIDSELNTPAPQRKRFVKSVTSERIEQLRLALLDALKNIREVEGIVGVAIALAPEAEFENAMSSTDRRYLFELALDEILLPDIGQLTSPSGGKRVFKVELTPREGTFGLKLVTLHSPGFEEPKWYGMNSAGPFFYNVSSFNYGVREKRDSQDQLLGYELFENGSQRTPKTSIGAFYSQMYASSDSLHIGVSVGVVTTDDSRVGYGVGLTTRIGGSTAFMLTAGQLYIPFSEARYRAGTLFGSTEEAGAAKTSSYNSFQWRKFIGLSMKL